MAIIDESRRKEFNDCTSFEELAKVCNKYSYVFETYADEIRKKLYELPAEFNEGFIKFLLTSYHLDNDLTEDNLRGTYSSLIRDYCNKIVNAGLFEHPGIKSDLIPVIVFSATDHKKIHMDYLFQTVALIPRDLEEIFYNHSITWPINHSVNDNEDIRDDREYARVHDILTSNAAYEDFLYQFTTELDKKEGNEYLLLRSEYIYKQCVNDLIDKNKFEIMDVYHYLTYLITTIEQNQEYLNYNQKMIVDGAIRNIYDSLDMILLYIPITVKNSSIPSCEADKVKIAVIKAIIDEAFLYMYRYRNMLNKTDFRKYFDICYDDAHNVINYRVIPDTPIVYLNKKNPEVTQEAYDANSSKMDQASRKIYSGYKAYKDAENKVDSQITKLIVALKDAFTGKKSARDRVIEGQQFSVIKIIKKIMCTAAIFSYSKIAGILFVITKHYCSKAVDNKERKRLISELELEIKLLDEKIEDARGDGNRQAKYSMMRTRAELQKALEQIKYGLTADKRAINTAKQVMTGKKSLDYNGPDRNQDNY